MCQIYINRKSVVCAPFIKFNFVIFCYILRIFRASLKEQQNHRSTLCSREASSLSLVRSKMSLMTRTLLMLLLTARKKQKEHHIQEWVMKTDATIELRRLTRAELGSPKLSPFIFLINSRCGHSLIMVTAVDQSTFVYLLKLLETLYK